MKATCPRCDHEFELGKLVGAKLGAALGCIAGATASRGLRGALVGAAVGGAVGHLMDSEAAPRCPECDIELSLLDPIA